MMQFTKSKNASRKSQRGLTLMELLVVLAILALLATLVAPRVVGYLGRAKSDIAQSQAANIAAALELVFIDFGRYPTPEESLRFLIEAPDDSAEWFGPYMKDESALIDPWGRPYIYNVAPDFYSFEIVSLGRDGEAGGERDDADIIKK